MPKVVSKVEGMTYDAEETTFGYAWNGEHFNFSKLRLADQEDLLRLVGICRASVSYKHSKVVRGKRYESNCLFIRIRNEQLGDYIKGKMDGSDRRNYHEEVEKTSKFPKMMITNPAVLRIFNDLPQGEMGPEREKCLAQGIVTRAVLSDERHSKILYLTRNQEHINELRTILAYQKVPYNRYYFGGKIKAKMQTDSIWFYEPSHLGMRGYYIEDDALPDVREILGSMHDFSRAEVQLTVENLERNVAYEMGKEMGIFSKGKWTEAREMSSKIKRELKNLERDDFTSEELEDRLVKIEEMLYMNGRQRRRMRNMGKKGRSHRSFINRQMKNQQLFE